MISTTIYEQSSLTILARIKRLGSNLYITQATTSLVQVKTYNSTTGTLVKTTTPTVSNVVYDSLQTSDEWREDEIGYNLRIPLNQDNFVDGDTNYRIEVLVTPTDGFEIRFAEDVRTVDLFSV